MALLFAGPAGGARQAAPGLYSLETDSALLGYAGRSETMPACWYSFSLYWILRALMPRMVGGPRGAAADRLQRAQDGLALDVGERAAGDAHAEARDARLRPRGSARPAGAASGSGAA